ncbi:MAG: sensor domain-containing diguanylate cyclase [Thermotogae bacterium]|nr:sensor domain-containing diguanylate cyclase [Thermotogota bacterium]
MLVVLGVVIGCVVLLVWYFRRVIAKSICFFPGSLHLLRSYMYTIVVRTLGKERDFRRMVKDVIVLMVKYIGADSWSLLLTPRDRNWYFYAWSKELDYLPLDDVAEHIRSKGVNIEAVIERKDVVVIEDTRAFPLWHEFSPVITWIGVPIIVGDEVVAVLNLDWFKRKKVTRKLIGKTRMFGKELSELMGAVMHLREILLDSELDPVTEVSNRNYLLRKLGELQRSSNTNIIVLFLDLDGFKSVNDAHGHLVGDQVLKIVAQRMKRALRSSDIFCRYGGDEFIVVLTGVSKERAINLGERLRRIVETPIHVDEKIITLSVSYGIAEYPGECEDIRKLIALADRRMYEFKKERAKEMR